jgi:anaerobic selenocysteine-containing dehydrogenase
METSQRQTVRTMCPMNCHPTLCGMLVESEEGRLVSVRGDEENPDSRGFLCVRGQASQEIIGNPQRLLSPLLRERRTDDAWRQVSWDEAFECIVARMQAVGREAVGVWAGHGTASTNYGTRIYGQLLRRFANLYGCQWWNPTMICWGLGAFGLGMTGVLETNTKEDMGEHAQFILLWGATFASQPNTARHVVAAKRRGAYIVTVDVRHSDAAAQADEVLLLRPGTDTALALAMMHVIIEEGLHHCPFVAQHTFGFEELAVHLRPYSPAWAAAVTGITAERIVALARRYATTRPAMIVLGGSSMHKGPNSWQASRAIACLPGLTGNLGVAGGGFGPRHASASHGQAFASIAAEDHRLPGNYIPNQMAQITAALCEQRVRVLLLFGTNMVSSFADTERVAEGLGRTDLVVSYDAFMNDTARRFADIILPSTVWVEELGCKATNTHLYLMEQALPPAGETRPLSQVLHGLAQRLRLDGFFPWDSQEGLINAVLDHPCTGHATVATLRERGGMLPLRVSHIAYPDGRFPTPSGKVEFFSARAQALGLPPLPVYGEPSRSAYPLALCQGRTLTHFHSFYDHGRVLPTLAQRDPEPFLWISPDDAAVRGLQDGAAVRLHNERGALQARTRITDDVPAGTVWMRDGWVGLNDLTSGQAVLPDTVVDMFGFSAGQASFEAMVEVMPQ